MSDVFRHAPRLRCPSCDGFVNLAAGVVDLTTGERKAVCWECETQVTWDESRLAVAPPGDLSLV
jgi:hypothetical protein